MWIFYWANKYVLKSCQTSLSQEFDVIIPNLLVRTVQVLLSAAAALWPPLICCWLQSSSFGLSNKVGKRPQPLQLSTVKLKGKVARRKLISEQHLFSDKALQKGVPYQFLKMNNVYTGLSLQYTFQAFQKLLPYVLWANSLFGVLIPCLLIHSRLAILASVIILLLIQLEVSKDGSKRTMIIVPV